MTVRLVHPPMKPTGSTSTGGWRAVRGLPVDLLVVVAFVLLADAVVSMADVLPTVRVVVGLPALFFVPGYVLLAVLFPAEDRSRSNADARLVPVGGGLAFSTRLALSFGISVATLPVLAVGLAVSPWGFDAASLLGALTALVVVGAVVGAARRLRLPPSVRFRVPVVRRASDLAGFVAGGGGPLGVGLNLLLVASVLVGASGLAYAVFVPAEDPGFTDFLLLTETSDGEYVSSGYPTNFTSGNGRPVVVGIANHREERTRYTVVVELQRVRGTGTDFRVVERSELDRFTATVGPGETWYGPRRVVPDLVGRDLRLIFYLYRGDAPAEPTTRTAGEHVHLWIDVTASP